MERPDERAFASKTMQFLQAPVAARRSALPLVPGPTFTAAAAALVRMAPVRRREAGMTLYSHTAESALKENDDNLAIREVGALPWRIGPDKRPEILLITPRKGDHWTLPRGLPAKGRSAERSAALRAFEQVGIIGQTDPVAVGRYSYADPDEDGTARQCQVTVFGLQVKGTLVSWQERKRLKRRWFGIDEAARAAGEAGLTSLLEQFDPRASSSRV
jgi:ADP-ribose pyrophosphatase YjhB (NUDIX family)